jgi:hypothetical protein
LYTALNNALDNNKEILIPSFTASTGIFLIGFYGLYFLPQGRKKL